MTVQRYGLKNRVEDVATQEAIDELRERSEKDRTSGSGAPTSSTQGFFYVDEDTKFLYIKIVDTWSKVLT